MPRIGAAEHGKLELFLDYILKSERHRLIGLGSGAMPIRAGEEPQQHGSVPRIYMRDHIPIPPKQRGETWSP